MLERTAVSIETCSLQKVLPVIRPPFTTRRRLHTNFWSHGASGVELLDACRALMLLPSSDREAAPTQPKPAKRPDTMTASAFLLDFLYPGGAAALLQRLRPSFPLRSEPSQLAPGKVSTRPFSSSAPGSGRTATGSVEGLQDAGSSEGDIQKENRKISQDGAQGEPEDLPSLYPTSEILEHSSHGGGQSGLHVLRDLLASRGHSYEMVWEEYMSLKPSERSEYRTMVLIHLANSPRLTDAERVSGLFSHLAPTKWTPEAVNAAVKANLTLNDKESALGIYEAAVSQQEIFLGIDALVSYGFRTESWGFLAQLLPVHSAAAAACGDVEYKELSTLPESGKKIYRLHRYLIKQEPQEASTQLLRQLDVLLKNIAKSSLTLFQPADANFILLHAKDPMAYQSYIAFCTHERRFEQAGKLYQKYRKLPGVHVPLEILRSMLDVFLDNLSGIEKVMEDYLRFHQRLEIRAIKKIMPMYARRGDVVSVAYLAQEWAKSHPQSTEDDPVSYMAPQMHAHAVRGEPQEARRMLDETTKKLGKPPGPLLWNILLNAYTKNNDYEGALHTLSQLCDVGNPDHVSFGTVMNFAAFRGDLDSTIDLFTLATEKGVNPDISMVDAVMEAYCQNDRFPEAEGFCHKMTRTKPVNGDYVILWNTLLRHLAIRRDLGGVNRALQTMKEFGVHYDNDTYSHLLTGLVNCRQSHHALQFLRTSVEHKIFRPTYDHYMLLMAAFVQSREPEMVLAIDKKLKHLRLPGSSRQVTAVIKAFEAWSKMPDARKKGKEGRDYIARALGEFYEFVETDSPSTTKDIASTTGMYSRMMFVLTQLRDFSSVQELLELYQRQFPDSSSPESIPLTLLHNLMLADFHEKKYDNVKSTWETILDRSIREGKPPAPDAAAGPAGAGQQVLPAYRFWLSKPLQTMQRLYLTESDANGLLGMVARVREAGFELDGRNWNYHIQALAALKKWREAFLAFEKHLMPHWAGWASVRQSDPAVKNLLPLEARRLGSYPRTPRPVSDTLFLLAREYTEMEREALWSKEASRALDIINRDCPYVVQAIKSLMRSGSELEEEILTGPPIDLGNGKSRRNVAEDYFEKVLFQRLGIGKTESSASPEHNADSSSDIGLLEKALETAVKMEKEPAGENPFPEANAQESEPEQWEDEPEIKTKTVPKQGGYRQDEPFPSQRRKKGKGLRWMLENR